MVVKSVDFNKQPWTSTFSEYDLASGISRPIQGFGDRVHPVNGSTIDPSGTVLVTGDQNGVVRVGRIDSGEPHVLLGHDGPIACVAISPDLEWIASTGMDETLRLWPTPDLSKPPLHTLPHEELIAKLKTLTNLRVVRDPESSTGWKLEVGPFPGWETVPSW
jgi:WD40 repeat protein